MYLDGLSADEDIPFRIEGGPQQGGEAPAGAPEGPVTRRVDAGVAVIDLDAMRAELEASRTGGQRR